MCSHRRARRQPGIGVERLDRWQFRGVLQRPRGYRAIAEGKFVGGFNAETASFKGVANGVPGLEVRLPMLFSAGVRTGKLSLNRFVELAATNAAKMYGVYPRKGTIAVGADADIALWDPDLTRTVSIDMLHDNMDYTPYEGREVTGWPVEVLVRGETVYDGKDVIAPTAMAVSCPVRGRNGPGPKAVRSMDSGPKVAVSTGFRRRNRG